MIRLGVMGYGSRSNSVVRHALRRVDPDVRVTGIVDPDQAGVRARLDDCDRNDAQFYPDLRTMMRRARPDALMIGTRCNLHTPYAVQAAAYDLPLYLEKPVAISMTQAQTLERAYRKARCPVVVSFPLRVSPLCSMTREFINRDCIGRPEHITALNYVPYGTCYWEGGYRDYNVTQGLFLQKATHDLDYMMFLMDSPIVRVAAMAARGRVFGGNKRAGLTCAKCREQDTCPESPANRQRNQSGGTLKDHLCPFGKDCGSPATGINEDASSALLEFASGAQGIYTQVFYSRRDAHRRGAIISGYQGTLDFDWTRNDLKYIRHHAPFSDTVKAGEGLSHFGGDLELAYDFIGIIKGRGRSRTTMQDGLRSVYACLSAKESAEKGRFVKVRQID
ncbi:MAG: Gfo/Idh/MocA family protein [Kiritimatiellia bacterium]|nr:Gfo/Idh/MocA family oxidoreductase [Lentisphaerota bacterium]